MPKKKNDKMTTVSLKVRTRDRLRKFAKEEKAVSIDEYLSVLLVRELMRRERKEPRNIDETLKAVNNLIAEEIVAAHREGQRTSRLTSLIVKIGELRKNN